MSVQQLKRVLVGRPIPTSLDQHERLSRVTGVGLRLGRAVVGRLNVPYHLEQ
jgi:hypothetical protein